MFKKNRRIKDSKVKSNLGLANTLTRNQYNTIELLLNSELKGCLIFDPRNNGFYKKGMIPCTLNDLHKALGKKVDKLFKVLERCNIVAQVRDLRDRKVWMINPDLYWDYVGYELYYNRWLFSTGDHKAASHIMDLSLYYGYYYSNKDNTPIKKIPRVAWLGMSKWWLLSDNNKGIDLLNPVI